MSFVGVLIIVDPFSALMEERSEDLVDLLLPLLSAFIASLGFIFLHDLKGKINQIVMLEYTYISQVLIFLSQVLYFNFLTNFSANDSYLLQSQTPAHDYF